MTTPSLPQHPPANTACAHADRGHADLHPDPSTIAPSAIETPRFLKIVSTLAR